MSCEILPFSVASYSCYSEQIEEDIKGEKDALEEAKAGITRMHKELGKLSDQVAAAEVFLSVFFLVFKC